MKKPFIIFLLLIPLVSSIDIYTDDIWKEGTIEKVWVKSKLPNVDVNIFVEDTEGNVIDYYTNITRNGDFFKLNYQVPTNFYEDSINLKIETRTKTDFHTIEKVIVIKKMNVFERFYLFIRTYLPIKF